MVFTVHFLAEKWALPRYGSEAPQYGSEALPSDVNYISRQERITGSIQGNTVFDKDLPGIED